jgi:hypothetical protein
MLTRYGAADQACVHAAGIGVAEAAGDGTQAAEKIAASIRSAIEQDGATTIVLGSGGLCGRAADLQRSFGLPVIDPVLWRSFHQVNRAIYEDQGAGSGLAIVKGLVELHGGRVTVSSREHIGSVFCIRLPLA